MGSVGKNLKFAIFGFFFNKQFSFNGFNFIPVKYDLPFWDEVKISKDKYRYNLTGYIETPEIDAEEFIFNMQAVLTFVQQQDVVIKLVIDFSLEESYEADFERRGCGAPFAMFSELQTEIVEKLYLKLIDENDLCNLRGENSVFDDVHNAEFKSLIFKVTEPFHMRRPFVEMTYFLYFSGLEAFCKQYLKSYYDKLYSDKAPSALGNALEKLNIIHVNVFCDTSTYNIKNTKLTEEDFLKLSVTTYSNLRNALFHSNKFIANTQKSPIEITKGNYPEVEVRITDYEYYLHRLCNAVILKYIGIENQRLDCSKWYTRFPLIKSLNNEGLN